MRKPDHLTRWVITAILLVVLGWGLSMMIEFYEETEQTEWSIEALRNPYLAATQFIEQSGLKVVEADSLLKLDTLEGVSTVLVTDSKQVINSLQLDRVLKWLEQGGTLIITANNPDDEDDLLLAHFEVTVERSADDADLDSDEETSLSDNLSDINDRIDQGMTMEEAMDGLSPDTETTAIRFGDDIGSLEIAFNSHTYLYHPALYEDSYQSLYEPFSWTSSDHGTHLIQFEVGDGLLTILSDSSIWTSRRIDEHDHAFLLWVLMSKDGSLAILFPALRDSIWVLLKRHAPEFLLALSLFIAFLIWNQSFRFGRIETAPTGGGRSLNEHFTTTALYLWHHRAVAFLLQPLRQQVLRKACLSIPKLATGELNPARQYDLISNQINMDRTIVETAFTESSDQDISLMKTVRLLKQIEKAL